MAKFDATSVETLEFDFSTWGGGKGVIDEPDTRRINKFFGQMRSMMKEVRGLGGDIPEDPDNMSEEQIAEAIESADESSEEVKAAQSKSIAYIAELCGAEFNEEGEIIPTSGMPCMQDLEKLPFRVLNQFSRWLMQEITPKKGAPAGKR